MSRHAKPPRLLREYYGTHAHPRCINCGQAIDLGMEVPLRARGHYRCLACEQEWKDYAAGLTTAASVIGGERLP